MTSPGNIFSHYLLSLNTKSTTTHLTAQWICFPASPGRVWHSRKSIRGSGSETGTETYDYSRPRWRAFAFQKYTNQLLFFSTEKLNVITSTHPRTNWKNNTLSNGRRIKSLFMTKTTKTAQPACVGTHWTQWINNVFQCGRKAVHKHLICQEFDPWQLTGPLGGICPVWVCCVPCKCR